MKNEAAEIPPSFALMADELIEPIFFHTNYPIVVILPQTSDRPQITEWKPPSPNTV
jgi:hypothetical protein